MTATTDPPGRRPGRPATISAADVVAAAVALIDEVGVDACTMRALAASMHVSPMTLYRHVADKQALLALIPDALLADVTQAVRRTSSAMPALTAVADGLAAVLLAHPGAARLFEQPATGPNMDAAAAHTVELLVSEGLSPESAVVALRAVVAQVIGEVITAHGRYDARGVQLVLDGIRTRLPDPDGSG